MLPETIDHNSQGQLETRISVTGDPFRFPDIFYSALAKKGYPVRFDSDEPYAVVPFKETSRTQKIRDEVDAHSISEILDSVGVGASNEILLLLTDREDEFYAGYEFSSIKVRTHLQKNDLEKLFMRAYEQWLKAQERFPMYKKTDYPKPEEKEMYEILKAKGVKPSTSVQMQELLIPTLRKIAAGLGFEPR